MENCYEGALWKAWRVCVRFRFALAGDTHGSNTIRDEFLTAW
jgi:hypothetical protein